MDTISSPKKYFFARKIGNKDVSGYLLTVERSYNGYDGSPSVGFRELNFYATNIAGKEIEPILVSKYLFRMMETSYTTVSVTKFYDDGHIEFTSTMHTCSDVSFGGRLPCDSTQITTTYIIGDNGKVDQRSDTQKFEYNVPLTGEP